MEAHDGSPPTRDDVMAAYRLLLGRAPESDHLVQHHLAAGDRRSMIHRVLVSPEFGVRFPALGSEPDPRLQLALDELGPSEPPPPGPDHWTDALGVRTSCHVRSEWETRGGRHVPDLEGDTLEWLGLLEAVLAAGSRLCVVELGAGHGPWLARAGVAWRRRGPQRRFCLVGVEAEPTHFRYLQEHMADNGLAGESTRLIEAAVAEHDGRLQFETTPAPSRDWGTRVVGDSPTRGLPRVVDVGSRSVAALSLATIVDGLGTIDLLHVDIQGDEARVLTAGSDVLRQQVTRLVVGTHGRDIEAELMHLLPALGFVLAAERPCRYSLGGSSPTLVTDGTQYWIRAGAHDR
ncbi:MAG: FkbM family methyltransferase [Actinomycetota bacterium]|nr:FkbM family methyltransferase [Actinomycetota bacterium]